MELSIQRLKKAPYNPRSISLEAMEGLSASLEHFGDIGGIVWNRRTGHLVCGHQRVDALRNKHAEKLSMEDNCIVTPNGKRVRVGTVANPKVR